MIKKVLGRCSTQCGGEGCTGPSEQNCKLSQPQNNLCLKYVQDTCVQCRDGYFLYLIDPDDQQYWKKNLQCRECHYSHVKCLNYRYDSALECKPGWYWHRRECLELCPRGYWHNVYAWQCELESTNKNMMSLLQNRWYNHSLTIPLRKTPFRKMHGSEGIYGMSFYFQVETISQSSFVMKVQVGDSLRCTDVLWVEQRFHSLVLGIRDQEGRNHTLSVFNLHIGIVGIGLQMEASTEHTASIQMCVHQWRQETVCNEQVISGAVCMPSRQSTSVQIERGPFTDITFWTSQSRRLKTALGQDSSCSRRMTNSVDETCLTPNQGGYWLLPQTDGFDRGASHFTFDMKNSRFKEIGEAANVVIAFNILQLQ